MFDFVLDVFIRSLWMDFDSPVENDIYFFSLNTSVSRGRQYQRECHLKVAN